MKRNISSLLLLFCVQGLVSCSDDAPPAPQMTPQQMYERAAAVLQPNSAQEKPDYAQAFSLLSQAAKAGYLPAIIDLAGVYLEGAVDASVPKDRQKALELYQRAAARGSAEGMYYCAFILLHEQKLQEAIPYLRAASDAGVAEAQYELARILLQENVPAAVALFRKAAESQRPKIVASASYMLGIIYLKGYSDIQADMKQAIPWLIRSADAGDARAQYMVALMYLTGDNMTVDEKKGEAMLRLSAGQDYQPAIEVLASYLFRKDPEAHADEIKAWSDRLQELQQK